MARPAEPVKPVSQASRSALGAHIRSDARRRAAPEPGNAELLDFAAKLCDALGDLRRAASRLERSERLSNTVDVLGNANGSYCASAVTTRPMNGSSR